MNIILIGAKGRMGSEIIKVGKAHSFYEVDKDNSDEFFKKNQKEGDVIIDFSTPILTEKLLKYATVTKTPLLIATTAQTVEQINKIKLAAESVPIFFSHNVSIGIALLEKSIKQILTVYKDSEVEIIETHHSKKVDYPSGTALMLAETARSVTNGEILISGARQKQSDIVIHSLRLADVVGKHKVIINTKYQSFTIEHSAESRELFAISAIQIAQILVNFNVGLYQIGDVLEKL